MSSGSLSRIVVLVLIVLGVLCATARYRARQVTQEKLEEGLWQLTYDIQFEADADDAELRIALPVPSANTVVITEEFVHPGLQVEEPSAFASDNRERIVTTRHTGTYRVTAKFDIRIRTEAWPYRYEVEKLTSTARSRYLRSEPTLPVQSPNVQKILRSAPAGLTTEGELLQWMFDYCADLQPGTSEDGGDDAAMAEVSKRATTLGRARLLVTLCRASGIPARVVTGFELRQVRGPRPHRWAEVFQGQRWVPFDAEFGFARKMPDHFVAVRTGGEEIVRARGVKNLRSEFAIVNLPPAPEVLRSDVRHPRQILDLTRLPLEMHTIMSLMLLLPLGALVTAVFRNVVGIRTFGTFSPALLAMSFLYAAWGTGVVILSVVIVGGLIGRWLLEFLHLLLVPRLSILLTTIILSVVFGVSLLDYVAITPSAQAVLLPLVILTIMIERLYVAAEEDSKAFSIQLAVNTFVVALFCYLLLRWEEVGTLILIYPELHFFTIATFIMIGRYTGYRLTELWRFRDLVQSDEVL